MDKVSGKVVDVKLYHFFRSAVVTFCKASLQFNPKKYEMSNHLFNALFEQYEYWEKVQHDYSKALLLSAN